MSNPWNGKVVLEAFWWNCSNSAYPSWYTYLAKLAPRLAAMGFDGIWTPPPCKDTGIYENMGYTPVDYYDLGVKNQNSGVGTWFGTQDEFLRMIAVAHANGLEVYPDIVIDHCGGSSPDPSSPYGSDTRIQPKGFCGPNAGRWPRNWLDFHPNPQHANGSGDWVSAPDGPDFCYQGRCTDSGNGDPNCAARRNVRAWFIWLTQQTGVNGFRFDDVKGYPPEVVADVLWNAMGDRIDYFCVGEFVSGATSDVDSWASATLNRCGTFDYPLRYALQNLVTTNGYFDVSTLPGQQQQNRLKTVPFVNNHDTVRSPYWDSSGEKNEDHTGNAFYELGMTGQALDPDNPRTQLACAIAMTVDGSPQLYYEDLFVNHAPQRNGFDAAAFPTRPWVENLIWCHQKLAFKSGDYFVRYQGSQQLLILERGARAIVAVNNDGSSWHDAWISTAFAPNTQLHDYSGSRPDDIWTNADGWVDIAVAPLSYSVWGPAGVTGGFSPAPMRTTQQFEMDDDLGDSDPATPGYGGRAIPAVFRSAGAIWPAAGSQANFFLYSDSPQPVDFQVVGPDGTPVLAQSGESGPNVPLAPTLAIAQEGRYLLQARLSTAGAPPARIYLKADYLGPATSDLY
jgi:alpha-amylase